MASPISQGSQGGQGTTPPPPPPLTQIEGELLENQYMSQIPFIPSGTDAEHPNPNGLNAQHVYPLFEIF